jgi:hypothetical protein
MRKLKSIDKFLIAALILFIFMLCNSVSAQERYTVKKVQNAYVIDYTDEWVDNNWYILEGQMIENKQYGQLQLTKKEYKSLIKDIKRLLNQTEADIERTSYSILKWSWIKDNVWIYKNNKGFGVTKEDIEILNNKLNNKL